jgi:hypothetical protein
VPNVPAPALGAPSSVHPAHAANRTAMAVRLADFLEAHGGAFADPLVVSWLPEYRWERIAELAGEARVPSVDTRAEVVRVLDGRQAPAPADPFVGLPS